MPFQNVEVKVTVKVNGERVGRRKIARSQVSSLSDGKELRELAHFAVDDLAQELRAKAGA